MDALVSVANVLYLLSYSTRDLLRLRILTVVAAAIPWLGPSDGDAMKSAHRSFASVCTAGCVPVPVFTSGSLAKAPAVPERTSCHSISVHPPSANGEKRQPTQSIEGLPQGATALTRDVVSSPLPKSGISCEC